MIQQSAGLESDNLESAYPSHLVNAISQEHLEGKSSNVVQISTMTQGN